MEGYDEQFGFSATMLVSGEVNEGYTNLKALGQAKKRGNKGVSARYITSCLSLTPMPFPYAQNLSPASIQSALLIVGPNIGFPNT